jgi:hypothetical protein
MGRRKKTDTEPTEPKRTIEDLDDEQQQALLLQHKEAYERGLKAKKAADAALKNLCKIAKAELGKDGVRMIKIAIRLDSEEGEAEVDAEVANTLKVARWMGASVGTQFELTLPSTNHFFDEGKRAGMKGETAKPPSQLAPGSDHYNDWLAGHAAGQAALAKGFKAPPEGVSRKEWKEGMAAELEEETTHIRKTSAKIAEERAGAAVDALAH